MNDNVHNKFCRIITSAYVMRIPKAYLINIMIFDFALIL